MVTLTLFSLAAQTTVYISYSLVEYIDCILWEMIYQGGTNGTYLYNLRSHMVSTTRQQLA